MGAKMAIRGSHGRTKTSTKGTPEHWQAMQHQHAAERFPGGIYLHNWDLAARGKARPEADIPVEAEALRAA